MFYNGQTLIRHYDPKTGKTSETNFTYNMNHYTLYGYQIYLDAAIRQVLTNSNKHNNRGLQNRRIAEAELLSSHKCPLYSKPGEPLIPTDVKINLALGKTILPYKHGNEDCCYSDQFYIWCTVGDNRVRSAHRANEGKMFSRDNSSIKYPKEDYGCRCEADHYIPSYIKLPSEIEAKNQVETKNNLAYFMRYGGGGTFLIQ